AIENQGDVAARRPPGHDLDLVGERADLASLRVNTTPVAAVGIHQPEAVAAAQAVERVACLQEGDLASARAGLLAVVGRRPVRVAPHTCLRHEGPGNVALYAADRDVEDHRLGVVAAVHAEG